MTDFNKEIQNLKNELINLEKNKNDINRNLDIIKAEINSDEYRSYKCDGSYIVTKNQDIDMLPQLQAIYNVLVSMNNKINDLEKKIDIQ